MHKLEALQRADDSHRRRHHDTRRCAVAGAIHRPAFQRGTSPRHNDLGMVIADLARTTGSHSARSSLTFRQNQETIRRLNNRGFTLIEIAIVLVVIGLLLGGVLKGQELITGARVRSPASRTALKLHSSDSRILSRARRR